LIEILTPSLWEWPRMTRPFAHLHPVCYHLFVFSLQVR
jgi:hypothetical protein